MLFALGAAVLAGNMYTDGDLAKDPPYMFQVAVGASDHVIFRTDMSHGWLRSMRRLSGVCGKRTPKDTFGSNSLIFDRFDINLDVEPAKALQGYEEIAEHYSRRDRFTGLITIGLAAGGSVELEFPINHLNLLPSCAVWQLETGPVLFVKPGCEMASIGESLSGFLPCFVHSNRGDSAEFSSDFPFICGKSLRSRQAKSKKICCQVQLLVSDK